MKYMKMIKVAFEVVVVILIIWLAVAATVFRLRHPWATETETFLNMDKALAFKKVSQKEIRE